MLPIAFLAITASHLSQNPIAPQSNPLTGDEAVRLMLQKHPRVQALVFEVRAAERGVASARAFANPEITVTPGLTRAGSDEELLITQPLEINGTRAARTGVAAARLKGVRERARLDVVELVSQTKEAFSEYAKAEERRKLSQELLQTAEELDRIAQRQVELGTRAGIEQSQTRIELHRARQQARLAEAESQAAAAALNSLIGMKMDSPVKAKALEFVPMEVVEADALAQALESHPSTLIALAEKSAFSQEARLARAEGLPDIAPHFRMDSITREPKNGGFGIGISIPLFDYGSRRNRVLQAEESARAQEMQRSASQNDIREAVTQAVSRLRAAEAVLTDFQGGLLDESKKLFEATRRGFQLGQSNITALLEAQRTYRGVQTEHIDALVSHAQAKAQLERAIGKLPEELLPAELKRQEKRR